MRTLLTWLVLACLLPGVLGALTLFIYEYREGRAQQQKDIIQTTRALVQAVDNHLLKAQAIAQALSTSDSLARHDLARFHQQARQVMAFSELGSNIVLRDEAGRQLLNTAVEFGRPLAPQSAPEQVRGVFATGRPTVSDLFIGPVLKRPVMSVDVPVFIDGKVAYALGVGIVPDYFNTLLKKQGLPPGWVAGVFDSTGTIVGRTHSPEQFVGRKANAKLLQQMMTTSEGSLETTTAEGIPVLSFYSSSPTTHWRVAIGIPRTTPEGAFTRTLSILAVGVSSLFAIGLLLAWLIGGKIAHSIKALTTPAVALGEGASAPPPRIHVEEAAEVAAAISRAADLLKERAAALAARETELADAHRLAKLGTWYWDIKTGEVSISDSLRLIYGRDVPPFPEQRGTLLTVESWERLDCALRRVEKTGGFDLELQVIHGSGALIWINAKCVAVRVAGGKVAALRGMVQDITERKHFETSLQESEERMRLFIEYAPASLAMFDCEMRYLAASRRWLEDYGLRESNLIGRCHYDVFPDVPERWKDAHRRGLAGEVIQVDEDCFERLDGSRQWLRWEVRPWHGGENGIGGIVIFAEDITRYKLALDEIQRLNSDLERRVQERTAELMAANRELDSFAYAVSHDLRAPLRAMSGFSQILEESYASHLSGDAPRYLKNIRLASRKMSDLIDGILALSRITRGEMRQDEVDLSAMAERLLEGLAAGEPGRQVHWEVEPGLIAHGDARMLESVMSNLLDNAWKYTAKVATANIRVYRDGDAFCIADNGAGFDPGLAANLFQPFRRLHSQDQFPGIGIGLATVQRIIQRHGGEIGATAAPGQGATFRFTLGPSVRRSFEGSPVSGDREAGS